MTEPVDLRPTPDGPLRRMYLPAPAPYTGAGRCPSCAGRKITGAHYTGFPTDTTELVLDVLCPTCTGCGRDQRHDGCRAADHAGWDPADDDDADLDPDADPEVCPSCHGRTWWPCQGFTDTAVYTLRVPCGCAAPLMRELPS